ncbi:hypothetical protein NPX13_g9686 [Xylaria arbuscula]|uniref:Uncharacterized protein n=1 Tax=Xylaria arbuscula TaxID=114810 RepID=A0A9W8N5Y2_9PEZI|nr:hypothetical protein NPX13_g9686 [Xylaria arbuscula]
MAFTGTPKPLPSESSDEDGVLKCPETTERKTLLELAQEPLSCCSESYNGWLVDLGGFENVEKGGFTTDATSVPATPLPTHRRGNDVDPCWPLEQLDQDLSSPMCATSDAPSHDAAADDIEETTECATPMPTQCSRLLGNVSQDCTGPMMGTTLLYSWRPASSCENQQTASVQNSTRAIQELKELEDNFQTSTKQRILQVQTELLRAAADSSKRGLKKRGSYTATDDAQG